MNLPAPWQERAEQLQREQAEKEAEQPAHLKGGGGGGTSGGMEPAVPLKDYVDAKDEAVETRLMAKLEQLSTKSTIWGAAATVVAIILAVLAFGGDRFDSGMNVSAIVKQVQDSQHATDQRQDAKLQQIDEKLDKLLDRTAKNTGASAS